MSGSLPWESLILFTCETVPLQPRGMCELTSRVGRRYFGNGSSAAASGYYAQMVYGNKAGVVRRHLREFKARAHIEERLAWLAPAMRQPGRQLRRDDSGGPLGFDTLFRIFLQPSLISCDHAAGHHRGLNGSSETVICPPTCVPERHFQARTATQISVNSDNTNIRTSLRDLCWDGNLIGSIDGVQYLGADLSESPFPSHDRLRTQKLTVHRMTHVPTVAFDHVVHAGELVLLLLEICSFDASDIAHTADNYEGVLQLAANNDSMTVFNSDTLQLL